jgi:hypothetical protein
VGSRATSFGNRFKSIATTARVMMRHAGFAERWKQPKITYKLETGLGSLDGRLSGSRNSDLQ